MVEVVGEVKVRAVAQTFASKKQSAWRSGACRQSPGQRHSPRLPRSPLASRSFLSLAVSALPVAKNMSAAHRTRPRTSTIFLRRLVAHIAQHTPSAVRK